MTPVQRLEIVIEAAHTPTLLEALREAGAAGYTLVRDAQGAGDRGERAGDELTDVFRNCLVIVACESSTADRVVEVVRPLLERHGGICLRSDARLLKH